MFDFNTVTLYKRKKTILDLICIISVLRTALEGPTVEALAPAAASHVLLESIVAQGLLIPQTAHQDNIHWAAQTPAQLVL